MDEPSIYDYIVSIFKPDMYLSLPTQTPKKTKNRANTTASNSDFINNAPYFVLAGLLATLAQFFLEPSNRFLFFALLLYSASAIFAWKAVKNGLRKNQATLNTEQVTIKIPYLIISLIAQVIAFILFRENKFNLLNIFFWIVGITGMIAAFWPRGDYPNKKEIPAMGIERLFLAACLFVIVLVVFLRGYQISDVPAEMYSDHAEKLLDVMDILSGKFSIFFQRNTGREPLQFYATAMIIQLFNTGVTFLSLKIGTISFGLLTLIFIYLLGKELANKWVGLASVFLAGVAYWPNVISRVALRYSLYPLFVAPVLYYLIKGLRTRRINEFILCGVFLGFGLHGYSSFRIVPVLITIILLIDSFGKKREKRFDKNLTILIIIGLISFSIFLPLFRVWFDNPQVFSYRMLTRLTPIEKQFEEPAIVIFVKNTIASFIMPFWDNGSIWVHSVPGRPALDFITGGFYFLGIIISLSRFFWLKDRSALGILLSVPFLMLPSILSLAYPGENPSLNRSAGAYVPVFIMAGLGFVYFVRSIHQIISGKKGARSAVFTTISLAIFISYLNYNLVFDKYKSQFLQNAWNTSEIGEVISDFLRDSNEDRAAFVIPYPHWVDTRLVGINAGYPGIDFALWPEDIEMREIAQGETMFIIKPEDQESETILKTLYPNGTISTFHAANPAKDFIIYTVLNK